MRQRKPKTAYPVAFSPNNETLVFVAEEFPNADLIETLKVFRDKALSGGWMHANWDAALRNYFRTSRRYGGVVYQGGREHDPRWQNVLHQGRKHNFRDPYSVETPQSYATSLQLWLDSPESRRSKVIDLTELLGSKRVN